MFGCNQSKIDPIFNITDHPIPGNLKPSLELISRSFYNSHMRNLDILYNASESKLYGLMTNYEGRNYCWVQFTRVKSNTPEHSYDLYLRKINSKDTTLESLLEVKVGLDCLAMYEADSHWYRAMVVSEMPEDKWLVIFIDYGNFQVSTKDQLKAPLNDPRCDHFHAPMQAVCCRLYNIVPNSTDNQEDIDIYMERFFTTNSNKFLEVIVRNIRPDYVVDCDIFVARSKCTDDAERYAGRHIGQTLVDHGLATFAKPEAAYATKVKEPEVIDLTES